ncbi:DUF4239 domain-containing protein [Lichenicoccus sp.]|uniref:bestrophin-like domain n=1 Tax=Lichenicoccus sp. TaxID=2781899 RepID=UPI003D0BC681
MMHLIMQPEMFYRYPLWQVGLLSGGAAVLITVCLECLVRRFLPATTRQGNNDASAAIFSVVGVTFAVLLAFVANVAWEGYNKAKAAAATEAAMALDVNAALAGAALPARDALRTTLVEYLRTVIDVEWPAQAQGHAVDRAWVSLAALNRETLALPVSSPNAISVQSALMQAVTQLSDARQQRILAAEVTVPGIVWAVTIIGGALTVAFSSFLGVQRLEMHLAMSCTLTISGVLVLVMILALSKPFRGDYRVSTEPFQQALGHVTSSPAVPNVAARAMQPAP